MYFIASAILFAFPVALLFDPLLAAVVATVAGFWGLIAFCRPAQAVGGTAEAGCSWIWGLTLLVFGGHWLLDAGRAGVPVAVHSLAYLPYWPFLAVVLFLAWKRFPPSPVALWWGVALAAAAAGAVLLHQWGGAWKGRVRTDMNAIPLGNLSLCFGVLALLGGLFWSRCPATAGCLMLAGVLGAIASLLSGTRGGWITIPAVALILGIWRGRVLWYRWMGLPYGWRTLICLLMLVLFMFAAARVAPRAEDLVSDLRRFAEEGNTRTSVGLRLDMWRAAWALFLQKPWLGWGEQGLVLELQRWISEGRLNEQAQYFGYQLHSDLLDTLARRGLVGGVTLILMYLVPAWLFCQRLRRAGAGGTIGMAGLLTVVMFAGFGLTQSQFRDPYTFSAYLVLVSALLTVRGEWGSRSRRERCC